jgi:hypothetical protein
MTPAFISRDDAVPASIQHPVQNATAQLERLRPVLEANGTLSEYLVRFIALQICRRDYKPKHLPEITRDWVASALGKEVILSSSVAQSIEEIAKDVLDREERADRHNDHHAPSQEFWPMVSKVAEIELTHVDRRDLARAIWAAHDVDQSAKRQEVASESHRGRGRPMMWEGDEFTRVVIAIYKRAWRRERLMRPMTRKRREHVPTVTVKKGTHPSKPLPRFLCVLRPFLPRESKHTSEESYLHNARLVERRMRARDRARWQAEDGYVIIRNITATEIGGLVPGQDLKLPAFGDRPVDLYWRKRLKEGAVEIVCQDS